MDQKFALESEKTADAKTYVKQSSRIDEPDGPRAWCVAFAACVINFIMAGLSRMAGILYVAFIEVYGVDRKVALMPFSVGSSTTNLLGPIVGILGQRYGVRAVAVTGAIIGSTSAASCFFADDITLITVIWGGINGAGTALTTTLCQVVIGQHFKKHKTTASGMAFSGGCIGSFLFPVLLENMLRMYGIQGTFLIIGGIIMHCIPAAMILRKPQWLKGQNKKGNETSDVNDSTNCKVLEKEPLKKAVSIDRRPENVKEGIDVRYLRQNDKLVLKLLEIELPSENPKFLSPEVNENDLHPSESDILKEMEDMYSSVEGLNKADVSLLLAKTKNLTIPPAIPVTPTKREKTPRKNGKSGRKRSRSNKLQDLSPVEFQSILDITKFFEEAARRRVVSKLRGLYESSETWVVSHFPENSRSDAVRVLLELRKLLQLSAEIERRKTCPVLEVSVAVPDAEEKPVEKTEPKAPSNLLSHLSTAVRLYTKPMFLVICLCRAVHFVNFIPVVTTIVDFAMDKGFEEEVGKYVIAALSIGDLMGRLCLGWVTDRGYVTLPRYMLIVMIAQAASTASLPLMNTEVALLPVLAVFGMLQGSVFVRHPVLVSKYMGNGEQSIAMGCVNLFSGLIGFVLPLYIGYFRDTIGSYDKIYYINAVIGTCVGLLWLLEPYFTSSCTRKPSEDEDSLRSV